eukprot:6769143-Pyramimonas_sp.AAC.1
MRRDGHLSALGESTAGPALVTPDTFEARRELLGDPEMHWDDVNGGWIEPALVREARRAEVE